MASFLDLNGLSYFWGKIKAKFIAEPATEGTAGQVLTTDGNGGRSWTSSAGVTVDDALSASSTNPVQNKVINTALSGKQETLVSGTNIKTINSTSLLGSGNIAVQATLSVSNASYTNATNFSGTIYVYKYGRVVTVSGSVTPAKTISAGTAWTTLAAAYRPIRAVELWYSRYNSGNDWITTINTNGNITFNKSWGTSSGTFKFYCAYISAS